MMSYVISQNDIPELNGKTVKITREKIGDITIIHFIDTNTNKEIYTKNVTLSPAKTPIPTSNTIPNGRSTTTLKTIQKLTTTTNTLSLPSPDINQPYIKYGIVAIIVIILIAVVVWRLGKDETEGEKK